MADMKLFIELMARSTGLKRELKESEHGFQRFGNVAKREMASLRQTTDSLQGKLAALGLTIGVLQQFRMSAQLDKDLTQIGQTAGAGARKVALLRSDLFRMGKESGEDINSLKNGFDSLVQSGLNMREATSTLDGVNIAMAVTGAKAETLSDALSVASTHFGFDLAKPGQALAMLDKMTVAGRLGNAEIGTLSATFSRVGVSAKSAGMSFDKTLAFVEALSLAEKNPERLGTLVASSLRMFGDGRYMGKTQQGLGMRNLFFDKQGARRDVFDVFGDIQKKYTTLKTDQQRADFIHKGFGEMDTETKTGIQLMLNGPNLSKAREFTTTIGQAGGTLKNDLSEATRNLITQGGRLKNTMREAADGFAKPINETMATWIQFMLDKKEKGGLELSGKEIVGGSAAIAGMTYVLARLGNNLLGNWAKNKIGSLGTSTAIGVAEGKVLQAATGVTPVFVTNWPGSGVPGLGVPVGVAGGAAGAAVASAGLAASSTIPALFTGFVGYLSLKTGEAAAKWTASQMSTTGLQSLRSRQLVLGNGGARSFQINTIDQELARRFALTGSFGDQVESRNQQPKNDIKIDIKIDSQGRVFTSANGMGNQIETMKRGSFFDALKTTNAM